MLLEGAKVLLGVSGGIAAYKSCELARMLIREGAEVRVVMTPKSAEFVTPLTFTALTGQAALVDEFPTPGAVPEGDVYAHLNLTREINCMVVCPATATTLAKLANGLGDNLLSACYLSCEAPVILAPAMNSRMWGHASVQQNVATLVARGNRVINPGTGELACGDEGAGRLAELREIFAAVAQTCNQEGDSSTIKSADGQPLLGRRIIITAGGTREYLDPVRFITNASSGLLALKLAQAVIKLGAEVELIDTGIEVPAQLEQQLKERHSARTAFDLLTLLDKQLVDADALVMLAAVADYAPARYQTTKHKKDGSAWQVEFSETPDVLATVSRTRKDGQALVGVSLEDTDWLARGMKKAGLKNVDAMLAVELGGDLPFGDNRLNCALVTKDNVLADQGMRHKDEAAGLIADWLVTRFER